MKHGFGRRSFLTSAASVLGAGFWADESIEAYQQNVQTASKPSELRITDVRMAMIRVGGGLIRLDTNQGVYGIGENRDGASRNYVMELKRLLVGENPCSIDKIFRKIKQFGYHARQGGGVCGVEMALWDLAGQSVQRPDLPDARRQVPGPHPDLLRHAGIPRIPRSSPSASSCAKQTASPGSSATWACP